MGTPAFGCQRMLVICSTGSGKTTLARKLAMRLGLEHIELDALYWEADWTPAPQDLFRERVERASCVQQWVSDGNYRVVRDILWPRAQAVIWLDYPLATVLWRLAKRSWKYWRTQQVLWSGNREDLQRDLRLWSDRSIFNWLIKSHARHQREYPALLLRPEYQHLLVVRFKTPASTQAWLDELGELQFEI